MLPSNNQWYLLCRILILASLNFCLLLSCIGGCYSKFHSFLYHQYVGSIENLGTVCLLPFICTVPIKSTLDWMSDFRRSLSSFCGFSDMVKGEVVSLPVSSPLLTPFTVSRCHQVTRSPKPHCKLKPTASTSALSVVCINKTQLLSRLCWSLFASQVVCHVI